MPAANRVIVATAVALLSLSSLAAEARTAPPNPAKLVPKISSVTQSSNAAALAAQLVGPGVTISNAKFTGATGRGRDVRRRRRERRHGHRCRAVDRAGRQRPRSERERRLERHQRHAGRSRGSTRWSIRKSPTTRRSSSST